MRNAFLTTVSGWLDSHMRTLRGDAADTADFRAWLASDYRPLAGGWQY